MSLFELKAPVLMRTGHDWRRWFALSVEWIDHIRATTHEQRLLSAYAHGQSYADTDTGKYAIEAPPGQGQTFWLMSGGIRKDPAQIRRIGHKREAMD